MRERERWLGFTIRMDRCAEQLKATINNFLHHFMDIGRKSRSSTHHASMGQQQKTLKCIKICCHAFLHGFSLRFLSRPQHSDCTVKTSTNEYERANIICSLRTCFYRKVYLSRPTQDTSKTVCPLSFTEKRQLVLWRPQQWYISFQHYVFLWSHSISPFSCIWAKFTVIYPDKVWSSPKYWKCNKVCQSPNTRNEY